MIGLKDGLGYIGQANCDPKGLVLEEGSAAWKGERISNTLYLAVAV